MKDIHDIVNTNVYKDKPDRNTSKGRCVCANHSSHITFSYLSFVNVSEPGLFEMSDIADNQHYSKYTMEQHNNNTKFQAHKLFLCLVYLLTFFCPYKVSFCQVW